MIFKENKIGILGGSFDPAHKGHLVISKIAAKKFKLKKIIWAITKKNPFKKKSNSNLATRIKFCKKIIGKVKFIKGLKLKSSLLTAIIKSLSLC